MGVVVSNSGGAGDCVYRELEEMRFAATVTATSETVLTGSAQMTMTDTDFNLAVTDVAKA